MVFSNFYPDFHTEGGKCKMMNLKSYYRLDNKNKRTRELFLSFFLLLFRSEDRFDLRVSFKHARR